MPGQTDSSQNIRSLASLAFLESQHDVEGRKQDSLDLLMPLVLETLQGCSGISFTVQEFSAKLKDVTGLALPGTVVSSLLSRCKGSKRNPRFLKVENGRYERTDVALECTNYVSQRNAINARHGELLAFIVKYAADHGLGELTPEDAGSLLSGYLDCSFRSLSVGDIASDDEPGSYDYRWLEKLILYLHDAGDAMFETVVTLVRGRVMFDAAFMPGFGADGQRLRNMIAYLDSPVLCRYMGFGTESDEKLVVDAVRILRKAGVICRVFEETAAEVGSIMGRIAADWGRPREDEAPSSFLFTMPARGRSRSEAQRVSDSPIESIEEAGFPVVAAPGREKQTVADESALAKRLQRRGGGISDDRRIRHDVNCIAAVLTQRGPVNAMSLGSTKCLFVSDSPLTICNVRRWWQEDEARSDIPPIFSIVDLANIAWLYGGLDDAKTFTKDSLMTTCAASMMPSDKVWAAFNVKLRSFVFEDKMSAELASTYLFNGCVSAFLSAVPDAEVEDGLSDAKFDEIIAEGNKEIAEKVNGADLRESKDELERANQQLAAAERANLDKDHRIIELSKEMEKAASKSRGERADAKRRIEEKAERDARWIVRGAFVLSVALIVAVISIYLVMDLPDKVCSLLGGAPLVLLECLNHIFGLQDKLAARLTRRRTQAIFPDVLDSD